MTDAEMVQDRLSWHDDDIIFEVHNKGGVVLRAVREQASNTYYSKHINEVRSGSMPGIVMTILKPFMSKDGVRITP